MTTLMKYLFALFVVLCVNCAYAQDEGIPDKDDFVEVSQEPAPLVDIQSLVEYPEEARRKELEGKVTVSALLGEDGSVLRVDVERSSNEIFTQSAVDAMKAVRFRPAKQGTKGIKVWYTQTIRYSLGLQPTQAPTLISEIPGLQATDELEGLDSISVEFTIDEEGKPLDVVAVKPPNVKLNYFRHEHKLKKMRFRPAERKGVPMESKMVLTIPVKD